MREHRRPPGLPYLTAVAATAAVVLVRQFLLGGVLGPDAPLYLFLFAVMAAAWDGGLKPGLLATGLSALAGIYFFTDRDGWRIVHARGAVRVGMFVAAGVVVSCFCEAMHRSRARSDREWESLREADRRKDEFLATLAHELRNPLAPIKNALQILRLGDGKKETVEKVRSIMERQLQQMVRLVGDLLDVFRIGRNKLALRKERVALDAVVQSAVEVSRPLVEAGGHELTVSVPQGPLFLDADPARLAQVFSNLLNNAAKYTPEGGHIRLRARREGSEAVVTVQDTGIGIPADMLARIFEPFTQVDRSLERSQGGLGIGLTLVKRLVQMHGGSVEVFSDGPGKGSRFVVRLPAVPSPAQEPPRAAGRNGQDSPPAGRRILLADDNRDAADGLGMMLRVMGNEVRVVYDGLGAVEAAQAWRPDVIVLDIGMPGLDGYAAARRIRGQAWGRHVVLVAVTGWGQDEDKRRSKEAGFDCHLVKPVDPVALQELFGKLHHAD